MDGIRFSVATNFEPDFIRAMAYGFGETVGVTTA